MPLLNKVRVALRQMHSVAQLVGFSWAEATGREFESCSLVFLHGHGSSICMALFSLARLPGCMALCMAQFFYIARACGFCARAVFSLAPVYLTRRCI